MRPRHKAAENSRYLWIATPRALRFNEAAA